MWSSFCLGKNELHIAVEGGRLEMVKRLLKKKPHLVMEKDYKGMSL